LIQLRLLQQKGKSFGSMAPKAQTGWVILGNVVDRDLPVLNTDRHIDTRTRHFPLLIHISALPSFS
jgi:hypothetical protein